MKLTDITDIALIAFFPLLLTGVLVYYNYSIIKTWKNQSNLANHGSQTQAKVTDRSNFKSTKGGSTWTLNYEFTVDNKQFKNQADVPEDLFNRTSIGNNINIIYLPENPQVSNIPNNYATSLSIWSIISLDIVILSSLIFIYFKYKS